jgi:putative FmdB family regulatory protein
MPLYEYRCRACGHRFEILQRIGQGADGLVCTRCGAEQLDKQFSTFAAASGGSGSAEAAGCGAPGCGTFT